MERKKNNQEIALEYETANGVENCGYYEWIAYKTS